MTDIVHRYEADETAQQVGAHYGISKTRVATVLREQGITIRRQGLTDEQAVEAAKLYAAGNSLARLGVRFGVSHSTIAAALRRAGIPLRPRPGWSYALVLHGKRQDRLGVPLKIRFWFDDTSAR
jgi:hypothetical protein